MFVFTNVRKINESAFVLKVFSIEKGLIAINE